MLETRANLIQYVPLDLADGDLYEPLPPDDPGGKLASRIFDELASRIEAVIEDNEPYEISLVGLKPLCFPVFLIGVANPHRIEDVLLETDFTFHVHVRQSYPAVFANNSDRNGLPSPKTLLQTDVPSLGASCGLIRNDRHSVSLGAYIHLSSHSKSVCMLTVPPTYEVSTGDVISQPSVADRDMSYEDENEMCRDILSRDSSQLNALESRRRILQATFELGRILGVSTSPAPSSPSHISPTSHLSPTSITTPSLAIPASNMWAVAEITRVTASKAMAESKPRTPLFKHIKPSQVGKLETGSIVSKRGRTTSHTIGTINGIKSLYRLPRDGRGVRRRDYIIISHPWGGTFSYPGDAGAIVSAHERQDIEGANRITKPGRPVGMIVAASTSGHVTFIQSLDAVLLDIERSGLGQVTFLDPPCPS